jgi:hypothetical protein
MFTLSPLHRLIHVLTFVPAMLVKQGVSPRHQARMTLGSDLDTKTIQMRLCHILYDGWLMVPQYPR